MSGGVIILALLGMIAAAIGGIELLLAAFLPAPKKRADADAIAEGDVPCAFPRLEPEVELKRMRDRGAL